LRTDYPSLQLTYAADWDDDIAMAVGRHRPRNGHG